MSIPVVVATVATMIFFNGMYVAAEFATVAARRTRISRLAAEGNASARLLLPHIADNHALDRYVAACQLGITISSLVLGAYSQNVIAAWLRGPMGDLLDAIQPWLAALSIDTTPAMVGTLSETISVTVVLLLITTLQVILGELFPKSVAVQYPERMAIALVWPMRVSLWLFAALIWVFNGSGRLVLRLLGRDYSDGLGQVHSPEEIELLVTESHEGGLLDDQERLMLRNAFRLRDLSARQVMVHRTRLVAAPDDSAVDEIMTLAIDHGFSRIPVYKESADDIVGFVHVKDLFRLHVEGTQTINQVIREVVYVPDSLPVSKVWHTLNTRRTYLAIVFDEFGGTAGLITFEDLIEEVFGELQDEFDNETALISRDKAGRVYLRGDLLVSDVNEYLELDLPSDSVNTLSGLIFSELGRPADLGDEVAFGETVVRVEGMEELAVTEISLQLPPSHSALPFSEWEIAEHE